MDGVIPLSPTLDHVGPLARTAADLEILFRVTSPTYEEQKSLPAKPVIGWVEPWFDRISPEVDRAVRSALDELERAGFTVREVELTPGLEEVLPASDVISRSEAFEIHQAGLAQTPHLYGLRVRERLLSGLELRAVDLVRALRIRNLITQAFKDLFHRIDFLVAPTLPIPAPPLGTERVHWPEGDEPLVPAMVRLLAAQNMAGVPALSLPCGFTPDLLPIGLQVVAGGHREKALLELGKLYQSRTSWHERVPPDPV